MRRALSVTSGGSRSRALEARAPHLRAISQSARAAFVDASTSRPQPGEPRLRRRRLLEWRASSDTLHRRVSCAYPNL